MLSLVERSNWGRLIATEGMGKVGRVPSKSERTL